MLINQAYNYLDKQNNKYLKYNLDSPNINFESTLPKYDMEQFEFKIYDIPLQNNVKPILKGNCSVIGIFNKILSIWQWGWSMPLKLKMENYISRKILNYAFDMDLDADINSSVEQQMILKTELLNSKLYMEYPSVEIEKYIAIALYITQADYYYKEIIENVNIKTNEKEIIGEVYYILRNVIEG